MLFGSSFDDTPHARLLAETVGIVGTTLLLGLYMQRVEVVLGWTGAAASTTILFILPPAIYLCLAPQRRGRDLLFLAVGLSLGLLGLLSNAVDL